MGVFDNRYCITDYNGNYYKLNSNKMLVEVKDGDNIPVFDILEANRWISKSGRSRLLKPVLAKTFKNNKPVPAKKKPLLINDGAPVDYLDIVSCVSSLGYITENIYSYISTLRKQLSQADEEISDVLHYIELYKCDEKQKKELVELLFDIRQRRRNAKDNIYIAEAFQCFLDTTKGEAAIKSLSKKVSNMETREYEPRVLKDLFDGADKLSEEDFCMDDKCYDESLKESGEEKREVIRKIVMEKNITTIEEMSMDNSKNGLEEDINSSVVCNISIDEITADEAKAEDSDRNDTIFDGVVNNWLFILKGQKEFFENLHQYRDNLVMDICHMEKELNETIESCDNFDCGVSEGYLIFKKIRDLRKSLRDKKQELEKVIVIISGFDCNAMVDKYNYCINKLTNEPDNKDIPDGESK